MGIILFFSLWLIFKLALVPLINLEAELYGLADREMSFMLVKSWFEFQLLLKNLHLEIFDY